jgi:outer membrane receptor for ferrienterochelin and colicins
LIKHILFIATILFSGLFSQHNHDGHGHGKTPHSGGLFTGMVLDSLTQKPIEYVSISIINQKDNLIETGGVTNEDGHFDILNIKSGKYDLKIEFMGYTSKIISNKIISNRDGILKQEIGTVYLNPTLLQLDAINVVEDKPLFEFETDKMIYNSSDDIISDSGTAEDVLNKVPMVTVDQEGSVSLRGNSNVKILVNGRQNRTGESNGDVDNIPASLIEKVEVITSPSAKYDPDGMAGIINIVLKKGKYEGLNGNFKINGKHNEFNSVNKKFGVTAYGNYKAQDWNVYSSVNLNKRMRNMEGYRKVYTTYFENDSLPEISDILNFDYDNESKRIGHSFKLGADYAINNHLELNAEVNYGIHVHSGTNFQEIHLPFPSDRITSSEDFNNNYDLESVFSLVQTFDNPDREFSISMAHDYEQDNEFEMLVHKDLIDTTYLSEKINKSDIDFSYKYPLDDQTKIEFGYDGRFVDNYENMEFHISKLDDNENYITFSGVNTFGYKRNIHSLFFEMDIKIADNMSIKPSIRQELVEKEISFSKVLDDESNDVDIIYAELLNSMSDSVYTDSYNMIYPDLHFTYNITEKQSVQFGLSKRVNRPGAGGHGPGSRQIRPFPRDLYSENFIFLGNPFLKPEYSTQYDISFKSPIPMGFAYTNFYYHQMENIIEWYDDDRFEGSDVLTFKNADSGENFGIELFTMLMGQTLGGGFNYQKLEDPSGDYELNGNDKHINMYSRINLPEKYIKYFDFEFGFYYMKMIIPGGTLFGNKGTIWANTGLSKTFYDDKATISLSIHNLFDQGGFQMQRTKELSKATGATLPEGYLYGSEFTDVYSTRGGRTFALNLKFRFGKMQDDKQKSRRGGHGHDDEGMMDMGF